jgi:hypothetical protein
MHTFRELLLGAFLSSNGQVVENERKICKKTPDWSILDNAANLVGIVEQVSHHVDRKTEDFILAQRKLGKFVIGYFPNGNDPKNHRIYSSVQEKVSKYRGLIAELQVPYVVAIFIDFLAVVEVQEVRECLLSGDEPLFKLYPDLSGVYYFCESNRGTYYFEFIENPYGLRKINLPTGFWQKGDNERL